jgi:1,2-diacylglycerol 3-alpha-glucosyltransferase
VSTDVETFRDIIELVESVPHSVDNVAILVSQLNQSEGAGNVAIRQLEVLVEAGYDATAFTFDPKASSVSGEVRTIGGSGYLDSGTVSRLKASFSPVSLVKYARELSIFDLIIVHQPVLCPIAYTTKLLYGTTTVYYNHHITEPDEKVGTIGKIFGHTAYRLILYSSSRLDRVVSVSKYSHREYQKRFGKSGSVIYNQIDHDLYNQQASGTEIRERYDLGNKPVILFVGRLAQSKNVDKLIQVYNEIVKEYPETVLLVVGRSERDAYMDQLTRLKRESTGTIIFTGVVPGADLPKYYAAATVYATCSVKEGYNLTIAEAEACGTPTVAFDIGAHPEVMQNGTLVEKGDYVGFKDALTGQLSQQNSTDN